MSLLFFGAAKVTAAQRQQAAAEAKAARERAAAQRKAEADAKAAQRKAEAAAKKQANQAKAQERKATVAAKQTENKAAAAARKTQNQTKAAEKKAANVAKKTERKEAAAAKKAMKTKGGKTVNVTPKEESQVRTLESTLETLKQKRDALKAQVAAKKGKRLSGGLGGLFGIFGSLGKRVCTQNRDGSSFCTNEGPVPDISPPSANDDWQDNIVPSGLVTTGNTGSDRVCFTKPSKKFPGGKPRKCKWKYDRQRGWGFYGLEDGEPVTTVDLNIDPALLVPPTPGVKPAGYDKRKERGKLKPQDMFYELSNTVQQQLFPLIQQITQVQGEILGLLSELNASSTVLDPSMLPEGFAYGPDGKIVQINPTGDSGNIDYSQLPPGSVIAPDGSITYGSGVVGGGYYDPYAGQQPYYDPYTTTEAPPGMTTSGGMVYSGQTYADPFGGGDPYASQGGGYDPWAGYQATMQPVEQPQGPDFYPNPDYGYTEVPDFGADPIQSAPPVPTSRITEDDMLPPDAPRMDYPPAKAPSPFVPADFGDTFNDNFFTDEDLVSGVLSGMGCDCPKTKRR